MFKWFNKRLEEVRINDIIIDLEIKQALGIVNKDSEGWFHKGKDSNYYEFEREYKYTYCKAKLSTDFTILKLQNYLGEDGIIKDLSKDRLKIKQEFTDLFEGLKLQNQSMIKLKKAMKDTLLELNN